MFLDLLLATCELKVVLSLHTFAFAVCCPIVLQRPCKLNVALSIQSSDKDMTASIRDELPGNSTVERTQGLMQQLSKLEDEVRVHRALLEAEEQLLYVDVITQLERMYQKLKQQRIAQGLRLTPWVRVFQFL